MALSKLKTVDSDQTLSNGLKANFPLKTTFLLANKTMTVSAIVTKLSARIAARATTTAAKTAYAAAVEAEEAIEAEVAPIRRGLQRTLQGRYGDNSTKLKEFSFAPAKRTKPTAAVTAGAVAQAQATKAARGIVGKKKRAAVKGVVSADGGVTASGGATQPGANAAAAVPTKATGAATATSGGATN